MTYELLILIFTIFLIPGIFMSLIPGLPGMLYMYFVSLVFASVDMFNHLTGRDLVILGVIVLLSIIIDFTASFLGAKHGGANKKSLIAGFIGLVVGTFIIPIPILGSLVGFFIGIFAGEHIQKKPHKKALRAATGGLIGALTGGVINSILGVVFIASFVFMALQ